MLAFELLTLTLVATTPERCAPFSDQVRATLRQLATADAGTPTWWSDAELLGAFVGLEPTLPAWRFVEVAQGLPDDACMRRLLGPMLERRAQACAHDACPLLAGVVFRRDVTRAIERDPRLMSVFAYALRATSGDGGLRIQVVSEGDDGGVRIHSDETRVDAAAEALVARGAIRLPVTDGDTPTTFGSARGLTAWRSGDLLSEGSALVACTNGSVKPLGHFLGARAVWQVFPAGWIRQFEYQLPCAASFVVPATHGIRPGRWRTFPVGDTRRSPDDDDPGPPYVDGARVRRFGPVSYREATVNDPTHSTVYGKRCLLEATVGGTRRAIELHSSYGCQLQSAADFNADGLADVVVHLGGESCEHDVLFVSGPTGWTEAGRQGSCE
jgi:hypothetical protein